MGLSLGKGRVKGGLLHFYRHVLMASSHASQLSLCLQWNSGPPGPHEGGGGESSELRQQLAEASTALDTLEVEEETGEAHPPPGGGVAAPLLPTLQPIGWIVPAVLTQRGSHKPVHGISGTPMSVGEVQRQTCSSRWPRPCWQRGIL